MKHNPFGCDDERSRISAAINWSFVILITSPTYFRKDKRNVNLHNSCVGKLIPFISVDWYAESKLPGLGAISLLLNALFLELVTHDYWLVGQFDAFARIENKRYQLSKL